MEMTFWDASEQTICYNPIKVVRKISYTAALFRVENNKYITASHCEAVDVFVIVNLHTSSYL